jgi:hypothetical protein
VIPFLKIQKSEREHILERNVTRAVRDDQFNIQDAALVIMEWVGVDYTGALEILLELGHNLAEMEKRGVLSI